jgi:L-threonylcarbamoyladenylate synthase
MIILVESERRLQELVEVPELAWEMMDLSEKPITFIYDNPKGFQKSF